MNSKEFKKVFDYLLLKKKDLNISEWRLSSSEKTLFAYDIYGNEVLRKKVSQI